MSAQAPAVSRRDGYLLIWESIRRPAFETREEFADVPEGDTGYLEISYGKRRGILDDYQDFYPDQYLSRQDALLWIYRTRNVAELPDMQLPNLPELMARYPLLAEETDLQAPVISLQEISDWMTNLDRQLRDEEHTVSFYAEDFQGAGTAFGETFNMYDFTAAHRSFPHNTMVRVTNLENGKQVVVRINDRGPYVHGRNMDLSLAAFEAISPRSRGIIQARFERLGDKDLVGNVGMPEQAEEVEEMGRISCSVPFGDRYQKRITRETHFVRGVPHKLAFGDSITLTSTTYFVVRSITFPDGNTVKVQRWVSPKENEKYLFRPSQLGRYEFYMDTGYGRGRIMRMDVVACPDS